MQDVGASYGFHRETDVCELLTVGHAHYCRSLGLCGVGEGDCDNDSECQAGLTCVHNVGDSYGFHAETDVCGYSEEQLAAIMTIVTHLVTTPEVSPPPPGHKDYCSESSACSAGEGHCDSDAECEAGLTRVEDVGASYGFSDETAVCELPLGHDHYCREHGPCGVGEGDCDGAAECQAGLICIEDVEKVYGFSGITNVCGTYLSPEGEQFLKEIEELHLEPYDNQTDKPITEWKEGATIGYGHLISSREEWERYKNGISEQQAEALFQTDIAEALAAVNKHVTAPLAPHQFDALVLLAFNIGNADFSQSSAVALINNPDADTDYASLEDAWKAWKFSQGKENNGLINRPCC